MAPDNLSDKEPEPVNTKLDPRTSTDDDADDPRAARLAKAIERMASLTEIEYELKRKEVIDEFAIRGPFLDKAVKSKRERNAAEALMTVFLEQQQEEEELLDELPEVSTAEVLVSLS